MMHGPMNVKFIHILLSYNKILRKLELKSEKCKEIQTTLYDRFHTYMAVENMIKVFKVCVAGAY
jgi:hypothetical protein